MAHIHEAVDFTVTCFILHPTELKTLLIHHKVLDMWLPVGGHIELDENPDQALLREVAEECGLTIEVLSHRHTGDYPNTMMLLIPEVVDMHAFGDSTTHRHVNFTYHARAESADVKLEAEAHHDIRWFTAEEIRDAQLNIKPAIRDFALEFLQKYS